MNSNTVAWYLNRVDAASDDTKDDFAERLVATSPTSQVASALGVDVDGDGDVDVVSAKKGDNEVAWHEAACSTTAPTSTVAPSSAEPLFGAE